ncbi:ABC transporter substrate-binding protein [Streptomyces sp. NPDC050418]|uniref:ABC transporter substrate-binding protein n=1 Tax=Streptomyces sp. NPDC050418 TaxID=3365612 RepID=UPI00379C5DC3
MVIPARPQGDDTSPDNASSVDTSSVDSSPIDSPVRIGALAPLSPPGWTEAGHHLIAGMRLAVEEVNAGGGVAGRPVELLVRDTAANPQRAAAAVEELAALGVAALAGEYHSVVARAAAATAESLKLPFLCSSAVIDALTEEPARHVARIAPPQSRGWRLYGDHLLSAGHRRIAVVKQPSAYWEAGTAILRGRLAPHGGEVVELDAQEPSLLCDALAGHGVTALLLLVGQPEPAVPLVRAVRADERLGEVLIGAPAGQPEFAAWAELLGEDGAGVPFLRYLPARPGPPANRVERSLRERLGAEPSFVAYEGYDTIAVLAESLRSHGVDGVGASWADVAVEGTRGRITFTRAEDTGVWQWTAPPLQIADRDPAAPDRFRVLRTA